MPATSFCFPTRKWSKDLLRGFVAEAWVREPEQTSLRRAFTIWIRRVVLAETASDTAFEPIIELDEVRTMLAQRVQQWEQEWRERSFAAGIEQGREEGFIEGERQTYLRLTRLRFDDATADALAPMLERISNTEQLVQIGEWIVQCQSEVELLGQVREMLETH